MKKILIITLVVTFTLLCNLTMASEKQYLQRYSDVSTWHWAYETIENLSERGIVSGYLDGTFMPEKTITRAEATKLLLVTLNKDAVFPIRNECV